MMKNFHRAGKTAGWLEKTSMDYGMDMGWAGQYNSKSSYYGQLGMETEAPPTGLEMEAEAPIPTGLVMEAEAPTPGAPVVPRRPRPVITEEAPPPLITGWGGGGGGAPIIECEEGYVLDEATGECVPAANGRKVPWLLLIGAGVGLFLLLRMARARGKAKTA